MDLGLDKLIEMIEQRFGKLAATAVLFAVTIGAFSWGLHAFFHYLVLPSLAYGATGFAYLADPHAGAVKLGVVIALIAYASFLFVLTAAALFVFSRQRKDRPQKPLGVRTTRAIVIILVTSFLGVSAGAYMQAQRQADERALAQEIGSKTIRWSEMLSASRKLTRTVHSLCGRAATNPPPECHPFLKPPHKP